MRGRPWLCSYACSALEPSDLQAVTRATVGESRTWVSGRFLWDSDGVYSDRNWGSTQSKGMRGSDDRMMPELQQRELVREPWLQEFLVSRGFHPTVSNDFSNGRATLHFEGSRLIASPAGSDRPWKTDFGQVGPETVRSVLEPLLAAPGFLSQSEIDRRAVQQQSAEMALLKIARSVLACPESEQGRVLRRLLWSMFNGHHVVNLWEVRGAVDSEHGAWVSTILAGWIQGHLSEDSFREALRCSGEMDRWDSGHLDPPSRQRLGELLSAISGVLRRSVPGPTTVPLRRAHDLIQEALEMDVAASASRREGE